jgi:hypothetical protein
MSATAAVLASADGAPASSAIAATATRGLIRIG